MKSPTFIEQADADSATSAAIAPPPPTQQLAAQVRGVGVEGGRTPKRLRRTSILVCVPHGGGLEAVAHLPQSTPSVRHARLSNEAAGQKFLQSLPPRCRVVTLLPKTRYLLRHVELPGAVRDEVPQMLRLEAGAALPPEFGAAEIAYREIDPRREGYRRFEVCIARRDDLTAHLAALRSAGLDADIVLPSSVAWAALHETGTVRADITFGSLEPKQIEAVSVDESRAISIRTLRGAVGSSELDRGIVETIRPLLSARRGASAALSAPVAVAWLGAGQPPTLTDARIRLITEGIGFEVAPARRVPGAPMEDPPAQSGLADATAGNTAAEHVRAGDAGQGDAGQGDAGQGDAGQGDVRALLQLVAKALSTPTGVWGADVGNLLPAATITARRIRAGRRSALTTAGAFVVAQVLAYTALAITVQRYQARIDVLSTKVAAIKKEGEAVGRGIEQLDALRAARATRNDFDRVVGALYDATQDGVTYSQIEVGDNGAVRLQGQATSLALPILLPERLEQQGTFRDVQLRDAAQSKRGDDSVAEFRIDGKLVAEKLR